MRRASFAVLTLGMYAAAALSANRAVSPTGGVPAAGGASIGIARENGKVGERVPVTSLGTEVATAGAAIANGALLQVGTDGKVITKDAGITIGRALNAAAADGDEVEVLLIPN